MIALGCTSDAKTAPEHVTAYPYGSVELLSTSPSHAGSARERLCLQTMCFDAGMSMLPIAPSHVVSRQEAVAIMQQIDLMAGLRTVQNTGQLTLSVDLPPRRQDAKQGGRSWLIARQAELGKSRQHAQLLRNIAEHIALPASDPRIKNSTVQCDILVSRLDTAKVKDKIAQYLSSLADHADMTLLITGLWPPFSFVDQQLREENAR